VWVYLTNSSPNGTTVPHILYLANALLIIVALVSAYHVEPFTADLAEPPSRLALWLPIVPLVGVAVSVAASTTDVVTEAPVVVVGTVLIAATLLRQFLESSEAVRRENEIRHLADRLTDELDSAAQYVASILPGPLYGPVQVNSRYRPARAVGGDSFGYQWVDDEHLIVYLIDVSGHGVRPALVSVSVHNHLRSGGLSAEVLLAPEQVLTELNSRFSMDNQDNHYFTMWFGVYRLSTGVLRYANAGHPPPLVLTGDGNSFPLNGAAALPVGMFPDSAFIAEDFAVPVGDRILLYSDGVLGSQVQTATFVALCEELAAESSFWLDDLIDGAPDSDDDCALVLLSFSASTTNAGPTRSPELASTS